VVDEPVLDEPVFVRYQLSSADLALLTRAAGRGGRQALAGMATGTVPGSDIMVEFGPGGVSYETAQSGAFVPWAGVEIHDVDGVLVLRHHGRPLLAVPARVMAASDLKAVARWAAQAPAEVAASSAASAPAAGAVAVAETAGQIAVRGVLTPERAGDVAQGTLRPWLRRACLAFLVLVPVPGWILIVVDPLRAGRATPAVIGLTLAAWGGAAVTLLWSRIVTSRILQRHGGRVMSWTFSRDGVTTASDLGDFHVEWALVRAAAVQGETLVVRTALGRRLALGFLIEPLSPEQRRRVFAWVEAGSGRRVHGAR
jgi:hypothetical protein